MLVETYEPWNESPSVEGISSYYEVEPMKETIIKLGDLEDPELQKVKIKSFEITPVVYWIDLLQRLNDPEAELVSIACTPPNITVNNTYTIQLVIEDVSPYTPRERTYIVNIFVKPLIDSGIVVSGRDFGPNTDTIKEAIASSPNLNGEITVWFDYPMIMPQDILVWTSENQGGEYFELVYVPSEESEIFFEEAEVVQQMGWKVKDFDEDSVTIQLNFTEPLAVSTSPFEKDRISFMILRPDVFIVKSENRPLKWKQEER